MANHKLKTRIARIDRQKLALIIPIAAALLLIGAVFFYKTYVTQSPNSRLDRINAIYARLAIGSDYTLVSTRVFGEKRVYEWDPSRTYSSAKDYIHNANVDTTTADLRAKIEHAGFTFFEEPYPGAAFTQLHFKSAKNEYVRLTVSSKPRDDANRQHVPGAVDLPPNQGPSYVILKVNLNDNNE